MTGWLLMIVGALAVEDVDEMGGRCCITRTAFQRKTALLCHQTFGEKILTPTNVTFT